jgi:hypothetical protein
VAFRVGNAGGASAATSYKSSSASASTAAGAGTTIFAPHFEHLPFLPAAASGALKRAPQLSHVTGIGIARSPSEEMSLTTLPHIGGKTQSAPHLPTACYNASPRT